MPMVILVADMNAAEPVLGPSAAERLGDLGITRIALLRDASSIALVLEGWAFDPSRTDEAVSAVFPAGCARLRTLHEVEQVGVSTTPTKRSSARVITGRSGSSR